MNYRVFYRALVVMGFLALCFLLPPTIHSATLLSTGFESNTIENWSSSGGGAVATVSADINHTGKYSIKITHDKTSSYGFQVTIPSIEPGMFYTFSGFGKSTDPNTSAFFLRVAWYTSNDGSGSQLSQVNDSNSGSNSDWINLTTQAIQAPSNANSAKVRIVLNSKAIGQLASAFFDDIAFAESIAPTSTPTPTSVPATSTSSPSPIPTFKPTTVITNKQSPTLTISPIFITNNASESSVSSGILGSSTSAMPTTITKKEKVKSQQNHSAVLFFASGILLLFTCGILIYRKWKKKKIDENSNE